MNGRNGNGNPKLPCLWKCISLRTIRIIYKFMSPEHEPLTVVPFDPLRVESHAISLSMTSLNSMLRLILDQSKGAFSDARGTDLGKWRPCDRASEGSLKKYEAHPKPGIHVQHTTTNRSFIPSHGPGGIKRAQTSIRRPSHISRTNDVPRIFRPHRLINMRGRTTTEEVEKQKHRPVDSDVNAL